MSPDSKFTSESFIALDVWKSDSGRPKAETRAISADSLISWISDAPDIRGPLTRILLCPRPLSGAVRLIDIPIEQHIYAELAKLWNIPSIFVDLHIQFIPVGTVPFTADSPDGLIKGYMIKSEYNRDWEFAAVILRNTSKNRTNGIVFGLKDSDYEERKRLVDSLTSSLHDAFCPLWLPSKLLSLTSTAVSLESARTSDALWGVQRRTGLHGSAYGKSLKLIRTEEGNPVDVEQCIIDLTAVLDQCARLRSWCETVNQILSPLLHEKSKLHCDKLCGGQCQEVALEIVAQTVKGAQGHLQWFHDSASSHLQTIYQITNQRDSQLNRLISERAQLDGSNMLLIAAMTMIFLPGGFVAAFFSMTMFDFREGSNAPIVSDWIWLYFVVTVILMVAVVGMWRYLVSHGMKRYATELGKHQDINSSRRPDLDLRIWRRGQRV